MSDYTSAAIARTVTPDMLYDLISSIQEDIKQLLQKQSETSVLVGIIQTKLDTLTQAQGRVEERVGDLETESAISASARSSILEGIKVMLMSIGAFSACAGVVFTLYKFITGV